MPRTSPRLPSRIEVLAREVSQLTDRTEISIIINAVRQAQQTCSFQAKMKFHVGDRVQWRSKYGVTEQGVVTGIMVKNISVETDSGMRWRVSPQLLSPAS